MQRTVRKKHGGVFSAGTLAAGIFAAALSLALADRAQAQCMYEVVAEISAPGCQPGTLAPITATAMNDHGVVVGHIVDCAFNEKPFVWSQETGLVLIPLPPGVTRAEPMDINNHGEIVGRLARTGVNGFRAFRLKDGVWTELPPTGAGVHSEAFGISDDGWVCGYRDTSASSADRRAFLWRDKVVTELSSLIRGEDARAQGINQKSEAAGRFGSLTFGHAFLWQGEKITVIPPVDNGISSDGIAINKSSAVTGQSFIDVKSGSIPRRSWVFENGVLTDLGTLPEADHRTIVNDINDAGQIVGDSFGVENASNKSFLWQNGQIVDLQSLILDAPEFFWFRHAYATNNVGQVVGLGPTRALVVLAPADRPLGDVNIDCIVDERDLIAVLEGWGPDRLGHFADIVTSSNLQPPGDGKVDGADLAVVLGNWSGSGSQSQLSQPKRR